MEIPARIKYKISEIDNKISEIDRFADHIMEELSKRPINWDQIYEYMTMIGGDISSAIDTIYDMTKNKEERDTYVSYVEEENKKIKERIVSKIKEICKT